jgi:hypothetical protein
MTKKKSLDVRVQVLNVRAPKLSTSVPKHNTDVDIVMDGGSWHGVGHVTYVRTFDPKQTHSFIRSPSSFMEAP